MTDKKQNISIYEKLQEMRVILQAMGLKKSGRNAYSKYNYYELADYLPHINQITLEHRTIAVVSFGKEEATLTLFDFDSDTTIQFTTPMSSAALKGCHEVQNLGAVQTYLRRYLYTTAFEIVENDVLDETTGKQTQKKYQPKPIVKKVPPEEIQGAVDFFKSKGIPEAALIKYLGKTVDKWTNVDVQKLRDNSKEIING